MNQVIVSLLNTLGLRSDPQTTVVFRNTVEAVTQEQLKDFTGDVGVDGTLNIDFTDTLDFTTTENADFLVIPTLAGRFVGDFIGTEFQSTAYTIHSGIGDGIFDLVGAGFQLPFIGALSGIEDIVSGDTIFDYVGVVDQTPVGGNLVVQKNIAMVVSDGLGGYNEYSIRVQKKGSEGSFSIEKYNPDGDKLAMTLDDNTTGFITTNNFASDASVHRFESNTSTSILDLLNDNLQSDVLLANNFGDDSAAAIGGVPVGGLYHSAGALRIRTV